MEVLKTFGLFAATALAELVAFEARHSGWDDSLKAFLWRVAGPPLPIGRLRPKLDSKTNRQESRDLRDKLARQIQALKRGHAPEEPKARAYPPRPTPPASALPRVR